MASTSRSHRGRGLQLGSACCSNDSAQKRKKRRRTVIDSPVCGQPQRGLLSLELRHSSHDPRPRDGAHCRDSVPWWRTILRRCGAPCDVSGCRMPAQTTARSKCSSWRRDGSTRSQKAASEVTLLGIALRVALGRSASLCPGGARCPSTDTGVGFDFCRRPSTQTRRRAGAEASAGSDLAALLDQMPDELREAFVLFELEGSSVLQRWRACSTYPSVPLLPGSGEHATSFGKA